MKMTGIATLGVILAGMGVRLYLVHKYCGPYVIYSTIVRDLLWVPTQIVLIAAWIWVSRGLVSGVLFFAGCTGITYCGMHADFAIFPHLSKESCFNFYHFFEFAAALILVAISVVVYVGTGMENSPSNKPSQGLANGREMEPDINRHAREVREGRRGNLAAHLGPQRFSPMAFCLSRSRVSRKASISKTGAITNGVW